MTLVVGAALFILALLVSTPDYRVHQRAVGCSRPRRGAPGQLPVEPGRQADHSGPDIRQLRPPLQVPPKYEGRLRRRMDGGAAGLHGVPPRPMWVFVWYVSTFPVYNAVYGSVGAVMALLTWVYVSAIILLFGAHITSLYAQYTARVPRRAGHKRNLDWSIAC